MKNMSVGVVERMLMASLSTLFFACVGNIAASEKIDSSSDQAIDGGRTTDKPLDKNAAQKKFVTSTDLMRHVIAPTCAAEGNECHNNEDFPDLHTEGNLWNLVGLACNLGVGERNTIEDYCEVAGDQIRVSVGVNQGFTATIGSIEVITDEQGAFLHYAVKVDKAPSATETGGTFEILHNGVLTPVLGGGNVMDLVSGVDVLKITGAAAIPDITAIQQGDENQNGVYGSNAGHIVKFGDARGSYMIHRLLKQETERVRMPLGGNVDNENEVNPYLSKNEMYVLMSWINCMRLGDSVGTPIRYDCPANANNEGEW